VEKRKKQRMGRYKDRRHGFLSFFVAAVFMLSGWNFTVKKKYNNFKNRLTSEKERGIILVNKDKHAIFIKLLMVYRIRRQTI